MKHLETILSFIISLADIVFRPGRRRRMKEDQKPPCCPCPYPEKHPECPSEEEKEESSEM